MARIGAERTDVESIWPSGLIPSNQKLIYLDLNHWIYLTKAATGHPDGAKFEDAFESLRKGPTDWTYVIGLPLIMELSGLQVAWAAWPYGTNTGMT